MIFTHETERILCMKKQNQMALYITVLFCCSAVFFAGSTLFSREKISAIPQTGEEIEQKIEIPRENQIKSQDILESDVKISPYKFVLKEEDGYVIVYRGDGKTFYDYTDISMESLPIKLQQEIQKGKNISDEEQLYHFLENYSS